MLMTRPRKCAGHVSATSIDLSDHSPLSAKVRTARAATKTPKLGDNATIGIIAENIAICWDREFADSPLEETGFEPSVPLGARQ
jgi:hypothetical protein